MPTGQTFGSNTSPSNWEPIARARMHLAQWLFHDTTLLEKHSNYTDRVQYGPEPDHETLFVQAIADVLNQGVLDDHGNPVPTEHHMFVDDNLIAEIKSRMKQAQAASIESLFILLGRPEPEFRKVAVCMEKFVQSLCSHERVQLGLLVNTRKMTVSLPPDKVAKLIRELKHWHSGRRSFNVLQAARLVGLLQHAAQVCVWARFLLVALQHSIQIALHYNEKELRKTEAFQELIKDIDRSSLSEEDLQKGLFAQGKLAQKIWRYTRRYFINRTMRAEIAMLIYILEHPTEYRWETPIAHLIPRESDYNSFGDSCLTGCGGFSIDLAFWWQLIWPQEIQVRTIRVLQQKDKRLISINVLEYATILFTFEAACTALAEKREQGDLPNAFPVLLNRVDNTSAETWTRKACASSKPAKALGRIFCGQLINNPLGLNAVYLEGERNVIADYISRLKKTNPYIPIDFTSLFQRFPILNSCRRYHPSAELRSMVYDAMLCNRVPEIGTIKMRGHFDPVNGTG